MEYTYKNLEYNESIPNRDWDFERAKYEELRTIFVEGFIRKIHKLAGEKSFVLDNSFNGVKAGHHIMYKCKVDDAGGTMLITSDGHIGYEFLVEFDLEDPEYGIYYGCRGHVKKGNQGEGIQRIQEYWEEVRNEVCVVLNNTFEDKDFTNRFQVTDNANNKTFWPFWIALGADEDIVEVAARATKLIRNVYKKFIKGGRPRTTLKKKTLEVRTKYTQKAYQIVLDTIEVKYGQEVKEKFEKFIKKMEEHGIVVRDDRYERCYIFKDFNNTMVFCLIKEFCCDAKISPEKSSKIPWIYFTPLFLSKRDESFDSIKKMKPNTDTEKEVKEKYKKLDV